MGSCKIKFKKVKLLSYCKREESENNHNQIKANTNAENNSVTNVWDTFTIFCVSLKGQGPFSDSVFCCTDSMSYRLSLASLHHS